MSRLDQHIAAVRGKLMLGLFVRALAWISMGFAALCLLVILTEKVLDRRVPRHGVLFLIGCGITVGAAFVYSFRKRPTSKMAAIAIDQTLGLKEKFSTALYMRPMKDPFAVAAVKDAEREASNVSLHKRFPIQFPIQAVGTVVIALAAFLFAYFMPTFHFLGKPQVAKAAVRTVDPKAAPQPFLAESLPRIAESVKAMNNNSDAIKRALDELNNAAKTKEGDQTRSTRSALQALQDMKKAVTEEMDKNEKFQTAQDEKEKLAQMDSAKDDSTPIGKAQNELKAGNIDEAMKDIDKAVADFNKMKPEDQQKAVDQAKQLADQLAKGANDPKTQAKIAQQMMQMGATQAQAQQMAAALQQAAQGNPQAQQQAQQMAQQMAAQMNNGQGPTQQQKAMIQKMMAQAQGMAMSQAQAGALSQSAKQLAAAMQQAKGAQGGQPGQQPKPGQGQGQGQMTAAQQQMQKQLKDMQAQAKDAQAMKAAADQAAQGAADAAKGLNPGQGADGQSATGGQGQQGKAGQGQGSGQGSGQDQAQGDGNNHGAGQGKGPGGGKMSIADAPYDTTPQVDVGKDIDTGKILASRYVHAGVDAGHSTAKLHDVAPSLEKDAPDEVDQDHVSRDAQQAVKDYFSAMQKDQ